MKASILFFFGFFLMWSITSLPEILSGEYDGVFSAEYEWNTQLIIFTIVLYIISLIIWNIFFNWLDKRYIVFKQKDEGILWRHNA